MDRSPPANDMAPFIMLSPTFTTTSSYTEHYQSDCCKRSFYVLVPSRGNESMLFQFRGSSLCPGHYNITRIHLFGQFGSIARANHCRFDGKMLSSSRHVSLSTNYTSTWLWWHIPRLVSLYETMQPMVLFLYRHVWI